MTDKPTKFQIFLFILLFIVLYIVISSFIAGFFMGMAEVQNVPFNNYLIPLIIIPSALSFGLPPIVYCLIKHVSIVDSLKLHRLSPKNIMYSILVAILLMPISSAISLVLQFAFPNPIQTTLEDTLNYGFAIAFLALAITPAIFEELMFRGLFFYKFRNLKPIHIALISSLTFGLVHLNVVQGVYATVMGFCFFYLVYYTGSIFSSMLAHLIINGTNITILYLYSLIPITDIPESTSTTPSVPATIFYVILAFICSALLYKLFIKIKSANQDN